MPPETLGLRSLLLRPAGQKLNNDYLRRVEEPRESTRPGKTCCEDTGCLLSLKAALGVWREPADVRGEKPLPDKWNSHDAAVIMPGEHQIDRRNVTVFPIKPSGGDMVKQQLKAFRILKIGKKACAAARFSGASESICGVR